MFSLSLNNIGKKFYGRWLFRNIELHLQERDSLALTGTNGSGKSTLMRIIAGQMAASEGKCFYSIKNNKIPYEQMYRHISWTGPQITIYPDFTLQEHIHLHFKFKKTLLKNASEMIPLLNLEEHSEKKLRFYSSGMLQRVKLGLALFSHSEILMLDEPTSNMDEKNAAFVLKLIEEYRQNRILILASNLEREYKGMNILNLSEK